MKRKYAIPLAQALINTLREEGLETPLSQQRIISKWPEIVGEGIAGYTSNLFIKNQILHVHVSSAPLRQELMSARQQLINSLNKVAGAHIIIDIRFQ